MFWSKFYSSTLNQNYLSGKQEEEVLKALEWTSESPNLNLIEHPIANCSFYWIKSVDRCFSFE